MLPLLMQQDTLIFIPTAEFFSPVAQFLILVRITQCFCLRLIMCLAILLQNVAIIAVLWICMPNPSTLRWASMHFRAIPGKITKVVTVTRTLRHKWGSVFQSSKFYDFQVNRLNLLEDSIIVFVRLCRCLVRRVFIT